MKVNNSPKAKAVAKKDDAVDRKAGYKEGSKADNRADAKAMKKAGLKGMMPEPSNMKPKKR